MQGNQDVEFRKLQVTGGSTMIVSLPKDWVQRNRLSKGEVVCMQHLVSGDLRISPLTNNETKSIVTIDPSDKETELNDLLIGIYLTGCDIINIQSSKSISTIARTKIREFLRDSRGMEIEYEDDKKITIISILNPAELRLQVSVNRMYILISSLVKDSFDVLKGDDASILFDIDDRERQIDARRLLIERQVAASIHSPSVERFLAVSRYSAMEHSNIARVLERMGDHAVRLATLANEYGRIVKMKTTEYPLLAIDEWAKQMKILVHNMYTKDVSIIHGCKRSLSALRIEIESAEYEHYTGRGSVERLFAEFKISESIRRLCAYGINFAESLINILMYEQVRLESGWN